MADIKYDIIKEIGYYPKTQKVGEKKLISSAGMVVSQNTIFVIGHQNMKRWVRVQL